MATTISVNDGLSQGMVFDLLQSRDGFLWIATKDGLNRYDGYHFKIHAPDPYDPFSIAAGEVWGLFEDSKGRIWVFYDGGIDALDPKTSRFYHVPKKLLPGFRFTSGYIACRTAESSDGSIWVAENDRLWKIRVPEGLFERADEQANASPPFEVSRVTTKGSNGVTEKFTSVLFSKSTQLLVGTSNGLQRLDATSYELRPVAMQGRQVGILGKDNRDHIFLSGLVGANDRIDMSEPGKNNEQNTWAVWSIEPGKSQPYFCRRTPESFKFDDKGNLWSFEKKNLKKWRPEVFSSGGPPEFEWVTSESIASSPYFDFGSACFDRSGIIWIGTNGYGIRKVMLQHPKFYSYQPLISQRRFFEDPSGMIICAESPELAFKNRDFSNPTANTWYKDPSIQMHGVFLFDAAGNCWINAQSDQLIQVDKASGAISRYPFKAYGLIIDKKQVLYGVDTTGLFAFDTRTGSQRVFPFKTPQHMLASFWHLHYLYMGADGTIWIFGFEGLIQASPTTNGYQFTYHRNDPKDLGSLSNDFVCSVADDPLQPGTYLWVGTKGGGLNRLDIKSGKFIHYKTKDGLPDNVVYGILSEDIAKGNGGKGRLWMSTNKGLSRFDIGTGRFKNFTAADGLQSNEFNLGSYLKTHDGHMIFGGVNGSSIFHPDSLSLNPVMPHTQIVGIEVNNVSISPEGPVLQLQHDQNFLNITFSALEFTNPGQNQYRYQLVRKGLWGNSKDEPWIELGEKNSVMLAGLQPGSYIFKVMGSNNDGLWNENPAVVEFEIGRPWWASWWAYGFYLLSSLALLGLYYRYRLRQRSRQQETKRLQELDEFKNRFFTNISHEFRTPLTVILGTTEQLSAMATNADQQQKTGLIKRSSESLLRLINQLLDLAKLESSKLKLNHVQGDVLPYLRYIAESLHSLANAQNVMLRVESPDKEIIMDHDPERLLQIVHNLLSNAIKFTPSGGRVMMQAALQEGWLHLTVTDNGAGIPATDLPHIFDRFFQARNLEKARTGGTGIGLALTRELVLLLEGDISVTSEPGKGTTFLVRLPVRRQAALQNPITVNGNGEVPEEAALPSKQETDLPTLLIVEDNPDVVEFLIACLEQRYNLEYAFNGRAGIEKALELIPDLIVSDVMMPEKDGFELCATLKQDERTSHVPIVLLTAKAGVENRITGLRHGADAYLSKPFHQEELLATLTNLLETRQKLHARYKNLNWSVEEHPEQVQEMTSVQSPVAEDAFLQKVMAQLETHLDDAELSVPDLASKLGLSQSQLYRKVKALTDLSTSAFIRRYRLQKGKQLLQTTDLTVAEIAYQVGFTTPNYFSDAFLEEFGIRPNAFRK